MRTILVASAIAAGMTAFAGGEALANTVIGNTPYLCFDRTTIAGCGTSDSPFATKTYNYFHLETFEDGFLNVPGATQSGGGVIIDPGGITSSVDADDGVIDGSGAGGRTFFYNGSITFSFNAAILGSLPTDVGIVWTDGVSSPYSFEFFDAANISLGSITAPLINSGGTEVHRFFGWTGTTGVGSMRITGPTSTEIDHLQFGFAQAIVSSPVPEPATWAMFISGFGLIGSAMRRRGVRAVLV